MLRSVIANQTAISAVLSTEHMRPSKEKLLNIATNPNAPAAVRASSNGEFRAAMTAIAPYMQMIAVGIFWKAIWRRYPA